MGVILSIYAKVSAKKQRYMRYKEVEQMGIKKREKILFVTYASIGLQLD